MSASAIDSTPLLKLLTELHSEGLRGKELHEGSPLAEWHSGKADAYRVILDHVSHLAGVPSLGPARISLDMGLGQVIEGTAELGATEAREQDIFITITRTPNFLSDTRARELIADAIAKGRSLGMPSAFAKRAQAILAL